MAPIVWHWPLNEPKTGGLCSEEGRLVAGDAFAREVKKVAPGKKRVSIATNPKVKNGLRAAWKRIECVSVAAYLEALTGAITELKWDINGTSDIVTSEFELLLAFDCAVRDRKRDGCYSAAACGLLMAEAKDMDVPFGEMEEAEAW
jgi:hypothetical protein